MAVRLTAILTIMLVAYQGQKPVLAEDGDNSFWRVDTRTPAHELPPGTGADAVNCRLEDGRVWPRLGISQQVWGLAGINFVPRGAVYKTQTGPPLNQQLFPPNYILEQGPTSLLTAGTTYLYVKGNSTALISSAGTGPFGFTGEQGTPVPAGLFTAQPGLQYALQMDNAPSNTTITAEILRLGNVCGFVRFPDPVTGLETEVLLTDDWRDQAGEDGGRGRAWKIVADNGPEQIPLNGNDIYGQARLISCDDALVMLRQDDERHYFPAANITGTDTIQLNCQPAWNNGDQVIFVADPSLDSALTGGNYPTSGSYCYVSNQGNNKVKLYADAALTQSYTFNGGIGRFYLQRAAALPGPGGNGAPPLIAQSNADGDTWDDVGFVQVPAQLFVSSIAGTPKVVTVPNHRLSAGDSINFFPPNTAMSGVPTNGASTPWYAYPLDPNNVILYTTQTDALGNTGSNYASVPSFSTGQYIVRTTASGQPMPSAREGYYAATQQTVLVVGANGIYVSDPLDPFHYEPLNDTFTASLGDADQVTAVSGISGIDALIILKTRSVYALYNFSQGPSNWTLVRVTSDYGCIAPLSVTTWGANLMFLSRRGYDRVTGGVFGLIQQAEKPVSWDMAKYVNLIDWAACAGSTAATWNNRLLVALPLKTNVLSQNLPVAFPASGTNNAVLSLNFLNSDPQKDKFGWEGLWTGAGLAVYGFAIHPISGEERLTFCDYSGNVNWLSDGWADETPATATGPASVTSYFVTRAYFKGQNVIVIKGEVNWDTFNPDITVELQMAGVNEIETLGNFAYQNNAYQISNATPYNPAAPTASGWIAPHRADYSPGVNELLVAQLDTFQNTTEPLRARTRGRSPQLVFTNTLGAMRLVRCELAGKQTQVRGTTA